VRDRRLWANTRWLASLMESISHLSLLDSPLDLSQHYDLVLLIWSLSMARGANRPEPWPRPWPPIQHPAAGPQAPSASQRLRSSGRRAVRWRRSRFVFVRLDDMARRQDHSQGNQRHKQSSSTRVAAPLAVQPYELFSHFRWQLF
jgi:hypothetical protein